LQEDTRSCGHDINLPFNGKVHVNDPVCKSAKAAQNALYSKDKAACEVAKATQNAAYATAKAAREGAKATQNGLYASQKAALPYLINPEQRDNYSASANANIAEPAGITTYSL